MNEILGILLGYEIGTGEPVFIKPHHLAVFGMTQVSGKTTLIEAVISRSGLQCIAFITKRGEAGFTDFNKILPYYKSEMGWRYVESLVDVALGEKVKYEPKMRYAIMTVSRDAKDLHEVRARCDELEKTTKKSWDREVYSKLGAYLDIVLPELNKVTFADTVKLEKGVNVVDLVGLKLETQQLIIASTIRFVYEHLKQVIVIIPEAWEMLPQSRKTPVKLIAEQFIRKGASMGNYLWLDSQDIGGIDKTPLRQVSTWIMGRMMEAHEVERIIKQLLGVKIPAKEIQTLPLGHFYVTVGKEVKKVYALPKWVPEDIGREVALGNWTPENVRDHYLKRTDPLGKLTGDFQKMVEELELTKHARDGLRKRVENLTTDLANIQEDYTELTMKHQKAVAESKEARNLKTQVEDLTIELNKLEGVKPFADLMIALVRDEVNARIPNIQTFLNEELGKHREWVHGHVKDMLEHPDLHDINPYIDVDKMLPILVKAEVTAQLPKIQEAINRLIKNALDLQDVPTDVNVTATRTKINIEKVPHVLTLNDSSLQGKVAIVYAEGLMPTGWFRPKKGVGTALLKRFAQTTWDPRIPTMLQDMVRWGFLTMRQPSHKSREYKVRIPPLEAKTKGLLDVKELKA